MNRYQIRNYTRPECGMVEIEGTDERDAVIKLIRMTGDNRGICDSKQTGYGQWEILIQNGWCLIVDQVDDGEDDRIHASEFK